MSVTRAIQTMSHKQLRSGHSTNGLLSNSKLDSFSLLVDMIGNKS